MTESGKQRNQYLDIAKGVLILLVVLGHCLEYGQGEEFDALENPVFRFIYTFHMPLFIMISGYLFGHKITESTGKLCRSALKSLVLPMFSWALTITVLRFAIGYARGESLTAGFFLRRLFEHFREDQWFLWAILFCMAAVILTAKAFHDSIRVYVLFMAAGLFLPDSHFLALYKYMLPFYVCGYLMQRKDIPGSLRRKTDTPAKRAGAFTAVLVLFAALFPFFHFDAYIYTTGYCILSSDLGIWRQLAVDVYRTLIGFAGSALVMLSLYYLRSFSERHLPAANTVSAALGRRSLGIYIVSGYLFDYGFARYMGRFHPSALLAVLETIAVTAVSYLVSVIISRIRPLNALYFGGR